MDQNCHSTELIDRVEFLDDRIIFVWIAEPAEFDDVRRSVASGKRETNERLSGSICDALLAPTPVLLPFAIIRHSVQKALVASDADVLAAMRFAYDEFRIVLEPGGAVGLAALLAEPNILAGRTALVLASGGNCDRDLFVSAITGAAIAA